MDDGESGALKEGAVFPLDLRSSFTSETLKI
jgi:hypothetical protein